MEFFRSLALFCGTEYNYTPSELKFAGDDMTHRIIAIINHQQRPSSAVAALSTLQAASKIVKGCLNTTG